MVHHEERAEIEIAGVSFVRYKWNDSTDRTYWSTKQEPFDKHQTELDTTEDVLSFMDYQRKKAGVLAVLGYEPVAVLDIGVIWEREEPPLE